MNCPTDGTTLLMSERNGIEIDYCPDCRGIWLDRGELDKILDAVKGDAPAPRDQRGYRDPAPQRYAEPRYDQGRDSRHGDSRYGDSRYGDSRYQKKKKSPFEFLGDLFEG